MLRVYLELAERYDVCVAKIKEHSMQLNKGMHSASRMRDRLRKASSLQDIRVTFKKHYKD
jgi:tRNA-dihydrouridine synthase